MQVAVGLPSPLVASTPPPSPRYSGSPAGTPKEQYHRAISLLPNDPNTGAERALKSFIKDHPEHELAGNAHY